jgi:formylglycine-generating enzyme required for sulfatase activity
LTGSIKATEAGDPAEEGWSMSFDSMMAVVIGLVTALAIATGASGQEILQAGQIIRDCSECPEMMVIHEGTFLMGSSADDVFIFREVNGQAVPDGGTATTFRDHPSCVRHG